MRTGSVIQDLIEIYSRTKCDSFQEFEVDIVAIFPQTWGSTNTGFSGVVAGQAMTTAMTIVLRMEDGHGVFINGRHAYTVQKPNELFFTDLGSHHLEGVGRSRKYESRK